MHMRSREDDIFAKVMFDGISVRYVYGATIGLGICARWGDGVERG